MSIFSDMIVVAAGAASAGNKTNLTQAMHDILEDYTDEVAHIVDEILQDVGEEAATDLRSSASAIGGFKDRTGRYRKSWTMTHKEHRTYSETIVYAKPPHHRLTHLLEYGHATRRGGRTQAFPHIYTVNEETQDNAVRLITKAIEGIR